MNTKLTLTLEKDIIENAKEYAKKSNRSLSNIVENYLKSLTQNKTEEKAKTWNPIVQSLQGSFKADKNLDYKKELQDRLEKKYL